jgi:septum formation protein
VGARVVLASRSPQRRAILQQLGVEFEVVESDALEVLVGDPAEIAVENARRKARVVHERLANPDAIVIGADTIVVLDGEPLGKPEDASRAREWLGKLAGRDHEVHGGLAVYGPGDRERSGHAVTMVRFRALTAEEMDTYVATGEWQDRAGGYAIQARGAALVEAIAGDYLNVVGLPVSLLASLAPELLTGNS